MGEGGRRRRRRRRWAGRVCDEGSSGGVCGGVPSLIPRLAAMEVISDARRKELTASTRGDGGGALVGVAASRRREGIPLFCPAGWRRIAGGGTAGGLRAPGLSARRVSDLVLHGLNIGNTRRFVSVRRDPFYSCGGRSDHGEAIQPSSPPQTAG